VAQVATVPKNSQHLRETKRNTIEAPHTSDHLAPNALKTADQQLGRIEFGQVRVGE
jgi:hypothetical protein